MCATTTETTKLAYCQKSIDFTFQDYMGLRSRVALSRSRALSLPPVGANL
jgi:hypothetical protein